MTGSDCRRTPCARRALRFALLLVCFHAESLLAEEPVLSLQMEFELGRLEAPPVNERMTATMPELLGITHISHRIDSERAEAETWRSANQALTSHLEGREQHLVDLQVFAKRQDGAIELMKTQASAIEALIEGAQTLPSTPPAAVAQPTPSSTLGGPSVDPANASLFGVSLASPYWVGGLLTVIAVLLAWGLGMRTRLNRERASILRKTKPAFSPVLPVREASCEADTSALPEGPAAIVESPGARADFAADKGLGLEELRPSGSGLASASQPVATPSEGDSFDFPEAEHSFGEHDEAPVVPVASSSLAVVKKTNKTAPETDALKEIDTLIAFENYEQAAQMLNALLDQDPDNPEFRLRLLHILSAAGEVEASKEQEDILQAMMDAPLSETLTRVRQMGGDLLPNHPLFKHAASQKASIDDVSFDGEPLFDVTTSDDGPTPGLTLAQAHESADIVFGEDEFDDFIQAAFDEETAEDDSSTTSDKLDFELSFDDDSDEPGEALELSLIEEPELSSVLDEKEEPEEKAFTATILSLHDSATRRGRG